jgi:hypothetical protein
MKYIPLIFICVLGIAACRKSNDSLVGNNGSRLISIVSDSAGTLDFEYSNNVITTMHQHLANRGGAPALIHYTNTDSGQIVSVGFPGIDYSYNYKLKSSKLPLLIFLNQKDTAIIHQKDLAEFIYLPGTDILDSVVYNSTGKIVYKFTYSGQDIIRITDWQMSSTQNREVATFDFTYGTTANIFRQTDPLLYIYSYPYTAFSAQPMVIAAFFAETFSKSTFTSITTSGITSSGWNQNSISSKMTYHLNSNGKVTSETFSNSIFEFLVGKRYVYE